MYAYKLNKRYKRRKYLEDDDEDDYPPYRGQSVRYYEPNNTEMKYVGYRQTNADKINLVPNDSKPEYAYSNANGNGRAANPVSVRFYLLKNWV
jgi:hypothetical protein